jgi:hypothetical protein
MESLRRFLNPLVLNLQKMELELTCPVWWVNPFLASCRFLCFWSRCGFITNERKIALG